MRGTGTALIVAGAALLAGCGGSRPGGPATTPGPVSGPRPARHGKTTRAPVKPGATASSVTAGSSGRPGDPRSPALRHLQALLVRDTHHAGRRTGFLVYDLTTGRTLFTVRAGVARPPASVAKLFTSVALLRLLGPGTRLHTDLLGTGHLGRGGVWHGNLYLRGDGDPTFGEAQFVRVWDGGHGALVGTLVAQLHHDGVRRVTGRVYGDGSRFDAWPAGPLTHGQPDVGDYGGEMSALTYDHGATARRLSPSAYAARQLARTMRAQHIGARAAASVMPTPAHARRLATVSSPPLLVLLKLMDVPSDDLFADLLTKQLGYRFAGAGSLPAGAREIERALARYHVWPRLHDGSGLDPADRTTPDQVTSLLRQIWSDPVGRMLDESLPVIGESGTVQGLARHTAAQGHCVAKTGTLDFVTNLAGVCAARGGDQLAFALFIDGPANWQAFPILGKMVAAIAAY